jgi:hypothetical protein
VSIPGLIAAIVMFALLGGWFALMAWSDPKTRMDAARRELNGKRGAARKERRARRRAAHLMAAERDAVRALEEALPRAVAHKLPNEE